MSNYRLVVLNNRAAALSRAFDVALKAQFGQYAFRWEHPLSELNATSLAAYNAWHEAEQAIQTHYAQMRKAV